MGAQESSAGLNWAGNVRYAARGVARPTSVAELAGLVGGGERVRALGSRHSFNRVADTTGLLVRVDGLPEVVEVDTAGRRARVGAGLRFGELAPRLHRRGLALPNMGSLPHISLAGAYATGTHGSGVTQPGLAAAVSAVELIAADGSLVTATREDPAFDGMVVSLGAVGVVTAVTLDLVPAFDIAQRVHEGLGWEVLFDHVHDVLACAYSVSVFTDWSGPAQVWVKRRVDEPEPDLSWTGARPADGPRHPVPGLSAVHTTEQMGVPGPWHERLPHFRAGFTPSSGDELQSEFFVDMGQAAAAVAALRERRARITPALQVSEIRAVAAETAWLAPNHGRDSVALHFTWVSDPAVVAPALAEVEAALAPLGARPHWGKVTGMDPDAIRASYPRADDFTALLRATDPTGKFGNDTVDRLFPR